VQISALLGTFLGDVGPEGTVGGFAGIIVGGLALARAYFEWRNNQKMKAMKDVPPSAGMEEEPDPEITRRLRALEHATVARMEWSITEARDECRRLQAELMDLKRDHARLSQELMEARYARDLAMVRLRDLEHDLEEAEKRGESLASEIKEYHRKDNPHLYTTPRKV
jgi:predicted RNase H-like nuclease (RuvC/YqgF family)